MKFPRKSYLCSVVVAGALAASLGGAGIAFAETAKDVTGYVSASNSPASQAAPEILGISGLDELQAFPKSLTGDLTGNAGLKYLLIGTDMYNVNPNPYFYNYNYGTDGVKVIDNKDKRRSSSNFVNEMGMPVRALAPFMQGDATDDAVWLLKPDIIIGNVIDGAGTQVTYNEAEYAPAVTKYLGEAEGSYTPIASTYTLNSMADIVDKTYGIAKDGEKVVADSNGTKQLRYGSALDIATNYEKYVKGTQAYILSQLEATGAQKKTVAVVSAVNEDGTYTLRTTPSKFSTASRFLEITTLVSNNLADAQEGAAGSDSVTVNRDTLAKADLIVLETKPGQTADMGDLATKTYWASNNNVGAIYKTDANSVEIGTNYGRILGCLYPEYVDQSDWVAYYYDTFYHVKADKLSEAIDLGMDGVRNWDVQSGDSSELLNWTKDTVKDYNKAAVQAKLDAGVDWIYNQGEEANELLQFSDQHTFTTIDQADAQVSLAGTSFTATGEAIEPAVTVKIGDTVLTEGTDYTVSYANNVEPGTATVTVAGAGDYVGTTTLEFTINAAVTDVRATRLAGDEAWQTALSISQHTFAAGECDTVVLARDDDFADSMSATGLAGALNSPILLIDRYTGVNDDVKSELARLGAKKVILVGGEAAVPANVKDQLSGIEVERVFGNEAADTSVECAKQIIALGYGAAPDYVVVAMSDNFQDALSMSSFAYKYHAPIILETAGETAADRQLPEGALQILNATNKQVFVAGGTGALSDDSLSGVKTAQQRLWGEDGFDTSNQIATYMVKEGLLSAETVTVASGAESAKGLDALAGAALAGKNGGVVLLANGREADDLGALDYTTIDAIDSTGADGFLTANGGSVKQVNVLGGTYVMPDEFIAHVESVINNR